jgi:hypothetical protein
MLQITTPYPSLMNFSYTSRAGCSVIGFPRGVGTRAARYVEAPGVQGLHDVRVVRRATRFIGVAIAATRNIAESVDPRLRQLRLMR